VKDKKSIEKKPTVSKRVEWLIHIIGHTLVLITVSATFYPRVYLDNQFFGLWAVLAIVIITILNRTIKPLLVWLTLPLTALTLGLFYPLINVLILKGTSLLLMGHFTIDGIVMLFFVSIVISIMNAIMDNIIIDHFIKRRKAL